MRYSLFVIILLLSLVSCKKDIEAKKGYKKGPLLIAVDKSYSGMVESLISVYKYKFPEVSIKIKQESSAESIADFVNGRVDLAIVGRDLRDKEKEYFENKKGYKSTSSGLACDASVFIASKKIKETYISDSIVIKGMNSGEEFIFENTSGTEFFTLTSLDGVKKADRYLVKPKTESITNYIYNSPKIGVMKYSALGGVLKGEIVYDRLSLADSINILSAIKGIDIIKPTMETIQNFTYPYSNRVYILNSDNGFNASSAFVKYVTSEQGQLIIEKEGFAPFFLYDREVELTSAEE